MPPSALDDQVQQRLPALRRGAPGLLRPPEEEQGMLDEVADRVVDLGAGALR